jgi:hypothetical protein
MRGLNVYQMIEECERNIEDLGGYPLFIKRDSWDDPKTVLEVLGTDPDWKSWCDRAEPYFGNPRVYGWLFAKGAYKLIEVSCPGTYAYKRVEQPVWWFPPAEGILRLSNGRQVELL